MKTTWLLFLILFLNNISISQIDSIQAKSKKHSFQLNIGHNRWAPLVVEQHQNSFEFDKVKGIGFDFGLHYQREFRERLFYQLSFNFKLLEIANSVRFNRNDFPEFYEPDTLNQYSRFRFSSIHRNSVMMVSFNFGRDWIKHQHYSLNTMVGLGLAYFNFNNIQILHFEQNFPDPDKELYAISTLGTPNQGLYGFIYSIPLRIDYINKKHKINWGLGLIYNIGFNPLFTNERGFEVFPSTPSYRSFKTSMDYHYSGLRLFVGI